MTEIEMEGVEKGFCDTANRLILLLKMILILEKNVRILYIHTHIHT